MSDPTRNEILVDPGSLVQAPHAPTGLINENFEPDEVASRHEGPMKSHKLSWVHLEDSVKSFGRRAHVMTQQIKQKMRKADIFHPFGRTAAIQCLVAIFFYAFDYGSDITVAYYLRIEEDTQWWFALTVVFIVLPLALVNIFSIVWFHQDHQDENAYPREVSNLERALLIISHVLLLGPIVRQCYILYFGVQEIQEVKKGNPANNIEGPFCINRRRYHSRRLEIVYRRRIEHERDASYLGLMDAFIQDGPQLILQIYILGARHSNDLDKTSTAVWQLVSILFSLFTLSNSMLAFQKAIRMADYEMPNMSFLASVFFLLWKFFIVASRVITMALFASQFKAELFLFIGFHYLVMLLWLIMMGTDFCGSADSQTYPVGEFVYKVVVAWVYVFDFFPVKEGPTRIKSGAYYILCFVETSVLITVWYIEVHKRVEDNLSSAWYLQEWFQITTLTLIPCFFFLGMVFCAVYYLKLHPRGKMPDRSQRASLF